MQIGLRTICVVQMSVNEEIMADKVDFHVGSQFESFADFEERLQAYEKQENAVFSVSTGNFLKTGRNVTEEVRERLKYKFRRYECLFYGKPRGKNRNNNNEVNDEQPGANAVDGADGVDGAAAVAVNDNAQGEQNPPRVIKKRQSKSYRQNCTSYFVVRYHKNNGAPILRITAMNENHEQHQRSKTLFKMLPKQRRATLNEAVPYLRHVMAVKPSLQLVQAHITSNSSNHGVVKRADLYNYRNRKLNDNPMNLNDFAFLIEKMQQSNGATIAVYHDEENQLEAVYFQDESMKRMFQSFPELLLFDGTFSLNDRRMPLIVLMVVDGNGYSQVVGLFLVTSENARALNILFEKFKQVNPMSEKIEVILTDKGAANINAVNNQFPNVAHHLCVFHVSQAFQREITTKKRNITKIERQNCLKILTQMIYSHSNDRYNELYTELQNMQCPGKLKLYSFSSMMFSIH